MFVYIFIKFSNIRSFLLSSTEKIFCEIDESIASQHDPSSDVIFLGAHSESIFPFMKYFFLKKTVFPLVSLSLAYC